MFVHLTKGIFSFNTNFFLEFVKVWGTETQLKCYLIHMKFPLLHPVLYMDQVSYLFSLSIVSYFAR